MIFVPAARRRVRVTPGLFRLRLVRALVVGDAEGDAQRVVEELIDVGEVGAIAGVVEAGDVGVLRVLLAAIRDRHAAAVVRQRMHGRDVRGAGDALVGHAGVGRLVDLDLRDELRRVLVELDRAVVVGRRLLAAVEGGDGEVGAQAADRQRLGAAVGALRGDAGQSRDGLGDGGIR